MVWSLSPSLDVKRFWPTESLTAQATEKTTTQGGVGCIYDIYSVFKSKLPETLFSIKKKILKLSFFQRPLVFGWKFFIQSGRFFRSMIHGMRFFSQQNPFRRCGRGSPCWLSIFCHRRQSILGCDDRCPVFDGKTRCLRVVRHVDKIWCTFTSWYYGEHISHGKNEVFFCFILAGSCQIFVHVCRKEKPHCQFFLGNFPFRSMMVNVYVFFCLFETCGTSTDGILFFLLSGFQCSERGCEQV